MTEMPSNWASPPAHVVLDGLIHPDCRHPRLGAAAMKLLQVFQEIDDRQACRCRTVLEAILDGTLSCDAAHGFAAGFRSHLGDTGDALCTGLLEMIRADELGRDVYRSMSPRARLDALESAMNGLMDQPVSPAILV